MESAKKIYVGINALKAEGTAVRGEDLGYQIWAIQRTTHTLSLEKLPQFFNVMWASKGNLKRETERNRKGIAG